MNIQEIAMRIFGWLFGIVIALFLLLTLCLSVAAKDIARQEDEQCRRRRVIRDRMRSRYSFERFMRKVTDADKFSAFMRRALERRETAD